MSSGGSLLCLLLACVGCRSRLLDPPLADGIRPIDAVSTVADLARIDLTSATCGTHLLADATLDRIELVDSPSYLQLGRAIRLRVVYLLSVCDEAGGIGISIQPGNATDSIGINAKIWRHTLDEPRCAQVDEFSAIMIPFQGPLTSPFIRVRDGAPGGTAQLHFPVRARTIAQCTPKAIDQPCLLDCECEKIVGGPGFCVPTSANGGVCAATCWNDGDCSDSARPHCDTTTVPSSICRPPLGDGSCGHLCGHNQECFAGVCRPIDRSIAYRRCSCDNECAAGQVCASTMSACVNACTAITDCPGMPNYCGSYCGYP